MLGVIGILIFLFWFGVVVWAAHKGGGSFEFEMTAVGWTIAAILVLMLFK